MTDKITETANKELKASESETEKQSKPEKPIIVKRLPTSYGSFYR